MLASTLDFDGEGGIRGNRIISQLMKAIYDKRPPKPKYKATWPVQKVLDLFKSWGPNQGLNPSRIARKTAMLLPLTAFLRCLEIAAITFSSVTLSGSTAIFGLSRSQEGSAIRAPLTSVHSQSRPSRTRCPVACLGHYIGETKERRTSDALFIGTVAPYKPVGSSTISRWLKTTLRDAGIDCSVYSAHSTRGAASSRAVDRGFPIDTVLQAG